MKSRPHIVTQSGLYDTAGLYRVADLLAARMGTAGSLKNVLGYSRVLIRVMKIILDLTLHNNCFALRREVLESPRLRKSVMERLGGVQALVLWRRRNTWNTARLAAIASGEYRPMPEPQIPMTVQRKLGPVQPAGALRVEDKPAACILPKVPSRADNYPAAFRLPVLQNLDYVHRPRAQGASRASPQKRVPIIVLWPHELDGQYVPDFTNRVQVPGGGGGADYDAAMPPPGHTAPNIFAPP